MAQIPNMTRDLNRIARALKTVFPELGEVSSVAVLGEGFRSMVVETPDGDVFKIAKNWEAAAGLVKEAHVLPLIGGRLSTPVPYPLWQAGASNHFPFGALGYPKLPGKPLHPDMLAPRSFTEIAKAVAEFLLSLHGVSLDPATVSMLPGPEIRRFELHSLRNTVLPVVRELLQPHEYRVVSQWWSAFLADPRMRDFTPALQHGDLWYENILVDSHNRLTGVIDFENLAIGDPAQDFATQIHLGRGFAVAVLDHYQAAGGILDEGLRYRMQRLWELREFTGMRLAIHFEDQTEFDDALRKLRKGPILSMTTRRETAIWQPPER
ncbi:N/A [soil metagenome]